MPLLSGSSPKSKRRRRVLRWCVFLFALVLCYGAFVEPGRVQVTEHVVPFDGLPAGHGPLRIVQITDLHAGPFFQAGSVRRTVDMANACDADAIVLTGDFVNYRALRYLPDAARELHRLHAKYGVYACLGNHDYWENADRVRSELQRAGIRVLMNENIAVAGGLRIAAVDDLMSGNPDLKNALAGIPRDAEFLLLSHNPTVLPKVADRRCIVIAGHTHGGQIAVPFLGVRGTMRLPGVSGFSRVYEQLGIRAHHGRLDSAAAYRYPAGWYTEGKARMYVCRGVGTGTACPIRLNCRPEIACFTLQPPHH